MHQLQTRFICSPAALVLMVWTCREKLAGLEAKHRSMLQDKNNLGLEKATMERELKVLRGQAAKFKQAGSCADSLSGLGCSQLHMYASALVEG